jgi:hypothetical protein
MGEDLLRPSGYDTPACRNQNVANGGIWGAGLGGQP